MIRITTASYCAMSGPARFVEASASATAYRILRVLGVLQTSSESS